MHKRDSANGDLFSPASILGALKNWHDLWALGQHPLADLVIAQARHRAATRHDTPSGRGLSLRDVLQDAVEERRYDAGKPDFSEKHWRDYIILTEEYVKGRDWTSVADQLSIHRRWYQHERNQAINRLASVLCKWEDEAKDKHSKEGRELPNHGNAPPRPGLLVGRDSAIRDLRMRLVKGQGRDGVPYRPQVLVVIRGWPGVGKTSLAAALPYDDGVKTAFPHGVLWASLGPTPNLVSELVAWCSAAGLEGASYNRPLGELSSRLTAHLFDKRVLLIVDDVWEAEHALAFRVGGRACALLITTRLPGVAQALVPTAEDICPLNVLTLDDGVVLLHALAPKVVPQYPEQCRELVRQLECLPLALQVAGRLLNSEADHGWGVEDLLCELRTTLRLLNESPPADMMAALARETTPTVAALLRKSTDRLDAVTRDRFALLGAFAPDPGTFGLEAMAAVWQVSDPKPTARKLVQRGLLEPVGPARFQMHALLRMLARSLLAE